LAQMVSRPHAREHQQLRRCDGPRRQDNRLRLDDKPFSTALHVHARGLFPRKEETPHQHIRFDGQIEPMADGVEISQRRAHADPVGVIHRERAHPHRSGVVHVRVVGEICRETRLIECGLRGQPGLARMATHRNGTVEPVKVASDVQVRFQFSKV
jgi:hypothetical protein